MQVILRDDMDNLGKSGEVVNVKEGYARNYLLPRGHAIKATETDVARVEHESGSSRRAPPSWPRSADRGRQPLPGVGLDRAGGGRRGRALRLGHQP